MKRNPNVPEEKRERNLEFYKRWRVDGEKLNDLISEYGFSYPRAYVIRRKVEEKYPDEVRRLFEAK